MVRKQVYIEPGQERLLKWLSKELGRSEAELIRESIDRLGRAHRDLVRDEGAWERQLAYIRERARRHPATGTGRTWKRDDAYAERIDRFSR